MSRTKVAATAVLAAALMTSTAAAAKTPTCLTAGETIYTKGKMAYFWTEPSSESTLIVDYKTPGTPLTLIGACPVTNGRHHYFKARNGTTEGWIASNRFTTSPPAS